MAQVHSWSIPVEFDCSMTLYICLICIAALGYRPRLIILIMITAYIHAKGKQYLWTFMLGAVVSQLLVRHLYGKPASSDFPPANPGWRTNAKWIALFVFGLYCSGVPTTDLIHVPYYGILLWYTPKHWPAPEWFWHGVGAALISLAAAKNLKAQSVLANRFARFLGRISYGLYLVHGIVIRTVSLRIAPSIFAITGKNKSMGSMELDFGIALILMIQVPVAILAAMNFTRLCDDTSIAFAKWLESIMIGDEGSDSAYLPIQEERRSAEFVLLDDYPTQGVISYSGD
jgi:peptidoglycan/LPS O-acetylase OafA/YrhL